MQRARKYQGQRPPRFLSCRAPWLVAFCFGTLISSGLLADEAITVSLDRPDPFQPAWGLVDVEAVVIAEEEIERVVFYVDGLVIDELDKPPWKLTVNLGEDIGDHRFEVIAYGASGATGRGGITTPGIQVNEEVSINLQQFYVTVTRGGRRVLDLSQTDFKIFDDKVEQDLVTFARGDIPFTAVVMVDSSVSMKGEKLRSAMQGAGTFFTGMQDLDEGRLLVFSDRILHSTPFTTFKEVLSAGLGLVEARGGTALNDHLYLSLKQLQQRQGRRVVVLLSDGVDSHSVLSMQDVLAEARRSQALIYWLQLPYRKAGSEDRHQLPNLTTPWRSNKVYQEEFERLRSCISESGGRIFLLSSIADIAPTFQEILQELREQYVLGYYPKATRKDGSWHEVKVRVRGSDLDARSRGGYLDY